MALTDDEQRAEYERRMDQMAVNIEKMRFDIAETQRQSERTHKWETRKFVVSLLLALAAAGASGAAIATYIARRPLPTPAVVTQQPPQVVFQPGSIVVTPVTPPAVQK